MILSRAVRSRWLATMVLATLMLVAGLTDNASAAVYTGNGNSGFGGQLGQGQLELTFDGTNINGTFTRGPTNLNDAVVLYIDSIGGGFESTSTFVDSTDGLRTALSGTADSGTTRTPVDFATAFEAEYGLAFSAGFAGLWELEDAASNPTDSTHTFIASANLTPTGDPAAATFDFSFAAADIGASAGDTIDFVATLISETAFRSDETIGDALITLPPGGGANPGTTGGVTFTNSESFTLTAVPEPTTTAALIALGGCAIVRRRRLKRD